MQAPPAPSASGRPNLDTSCTSAEVWLSMQPENMLPIGCRDGGRDETGGSMGHDEHSIIVACMYKKGRFIPRYTTAVLPMVLLFGAPTRSFTADAAAEATTGPATTIFGAQQQSLSLHHALAADDPAGI